jgi:hypothetical protein
MSLSRIFDIFDIYLILGKSMSFHVFNYWIKMNLGSYEKANNRLSLEFEFELVSSSQTWTLIGFWVATRIIQLCFVLYLLFWKAET